MASLNRGLGKREAIFVAVINNRAVYKLSVSFDPAFKQQLWPISYGYYYLALSNNQDQEDDVVFRPQIEMAELEAKILLIDLKNMRHADFFEQIGYTTPTR